MNHKGTTKLETNRLILRKFVIEDAKAMYENWASEDEVTKFLTWPTHSSIEDTKIVLNNWISSYEKLDFYNWAIEIKESGQVIGNISVPRKNDNIFCCEIGYCLSSDYWGKGYMPEAMKAVMDLLFMKVNYNRIECFHKVENTNSGRVMEKVGMKCEGLLRDRGLKNDGTVCDSKIWSILKREYLCLKEKK